MPQLAAAPESLRTMVLIFGTAILRHAALRLATQGYGKQSLNSGHFGMQNCRSTLRIRDGDREALAIFQVKRQPLTAV